MRCPLLEQPCLRPPPSPTSSPSVLPPSPSVSFLLAAFLFSTPLRALPLFLPLLSLPHLLFAHPFAPPSTLAARLPPIIIFNSPWCSASPPPSLSRSSLPVLSLRAPGPPLARFSLLFERCAWPRKKLRNIISETEERLLTVPVGAPPPPPSRRVVSASRFDARTTATSVNERVDSLRGTSKSHTERRERRVVVAKRTHEKAK